jgi:putative ABC transport system permease protein
MSHLGLRWRYAFRDLWLHKTRTILVILSIGVGVFAFALIWGTAGTLSTELPAHYLAVHPASATLHTTFLDEEFLDAVERMPEVAAAEGRHSTLIRFRKPSGEWHDMRLFALQDYKDSRINRVYPYQGEWPPADRMILIERNSLFLTELSVGDSLVVETANGDQRPLPIAGLAHDMNQPPAQITGVPYAYVTRDTLEWLGLDNEFNLLYLIVAERPFDRAHIRDVARAAADKLERAGAIVFWEEVPEPGKHFVQEFLPTILLILGSLGILALVLSGLLVTNVIMAILTQQTRQIGVMKAIGARPVQIASIYLRMVLFFGAAALVMAIPLGALAAFGFSRFVAGQLNFDLTRLEIVPWVLALEILVGLLVPVLAAIYPVASTARATVHEAIQDSGLDATPVGQTQVGKALQKAQETLGLSRPLRLSLRNTFRRKGRLARTLIPLVLGGAIFMTVLSLRASMFRTLEEMLASQGFDVQIQLNQPYRIRRIEREAAQIPEITRLEAWGFREGVPIRPGGVQGDSVFVYALPADTELFTPDLIAGRWLEPGDTNAIVVAVGLLEDEPDLEVGSELALKIGDEEITWHVVGIHRAFQPPIAPPVVYVNQPYFWQELGSHGQTDMVRIVTTHHDAESQTRVAQALEDRLQAALIEVRSTRTASEDRRIFTERFNIITVIYMVMAVLMATVGGLGLMGTMSINVLERKREIGVMRAIGASDRAVLQIFVIEGVIIGQISWLGALILSQPMSRFMSIRVGMVFAKLPLSYVFDLSAPLLWMVIVVVVAALASLAPAYSAARIAVRETLAYE